MVDFCAALEVQVICFRWRQGIDWKAEAVGGHVGNAVHLVNAESVGGKFGESRLAKVDRDMTITMALPGEGSAQEIVSIPHKINF